MWCRLSVTISLCSLFSGCDVPITYAKATVPLVAPVDSTCLERALTTRFGPADMKPFVEEPVGTREKSPLMLTFYYHRSMFRQTYGDTGLSSLFGAKSVGDGIFTALWPPHARLDSVGHALGVELLELRNACGGRTPPGVDEVTIGR